MDMIMNRGRGTAKSVNNGQAQRRCEEARMKNSPNHACASFFPPNPLRASAPLRLCGYLIGVGVLLWAVSSRPARADVTAEQVNTAISQGVAFLEKQQRPDGRFYEYESEPGGGTALVTLALLNCGRNPKEHE